MKLTNKEKALRELRRAINSIALMNDYAPRNYAHINTTWRHVAKTAKRAKAKVDELLSVHNVDD